MGDPTRVRFRTDRGRDPDRFVGLVSTVVATTRPADHDPAHWRDLLEAGRPGSDTVADDPLPRLDLAPSGTKARPRAVKSA